ncbi:Nif3-like dinuclear metal center hexameric protein [Marinospirillum insulare]|uniref:GTP cyclohydrolase 1 type 2 n=1 Tax=Marinospirillum insulare TaxID=217169 RepID=A0ABQ5ZWZ9_9GAMM|nr:Nif3-like dinuclear metal center hexameric protein [Marinospirillum insulare]GLR63166.1 GTP cyclohydrolase 1 type 2 [Marinospirillum insulare]
MTIELSKLVESLDKHLQVEDFKDYCPNGLQVEGKSQIRKIVTGVTASQALIEKAIASKADALLVHHGYFWKGEAQPLVGMKGRRVAALMRNNISLIAYHLPLDVHPVLGNNQQLAEVMDWTVTGVMDSPSWPLGLVGELTQPLTAKDFSEQLSIKLGQQPLHLAGHDRKIKTLAWCTGSAEGGIYRAAELGVDAYISGEVSEQTLHAAQELGIDYFAAGHHATERYGVKALGEWIANQWQVECEFIDLPNPV